MRCAAASASQICEGDAQLARAAHARLDRFGQRHAVDQLQNEKIALVGLYIFMDTADVRMIEGGQRAGLAEKTAAGVDAQSAVDADGLQCHSAVEPLVKRAIDLTHAARAEGVGDAEVSNAGANHAVRLTSRSNDGTPIRPMRGRLERVPVLPFAISCIRCAHGSPLQSTLDFKF